MAKRIDYNRVQELYNPGLTDHDNALNMGISRSSFIKWRLSKGYRCPAKYNKVTQIKPRDFYKYYYMGYSDKNIADVLNTTHVSVFAYRKAHNLPKNRRIPTDVDYIPDDNCKPWKDPESMYCDKEFLDKFVNGDFV